MTPFGNDSMLAELEAAEEQCKKDGKFCSNCGQIRFSGSSCIDMTCWRGYIDGDHDGWVAGGKNSPNAKFHQESTRNVAKDEDYKYCPFKSSPSIRLLQKGWL